MATFLAQLDAGYTAEGFLVNLAIAAVSAVLGAIGALIVANYTLAVTARQAELERRQDALEAESRRKREADEAAAAARQVAHEARVRALRAVQVEVDLNIEALRISRAPTSPPANLRLTQLERAMEHLRDLPSDVAEPLQRALFAADRYQSMRSAHYPDRMQYAAQADTEFSLARSALYELLGEPVGEE